MSEERPNYAASQEADDTITDIDTSTSTSFDNEIVTRADLAHLRILKQAQESGAGVIHLPRPSVERSVPNAEDPPEWIIFSWDSAMLRFHKQAYFTPGA